MQDLIHSMGIAEKGVAGAATLARGQSHANDFLDKKQRAKKKQSVHSASRRKNVDQQTQARHVNRTAIEILNAEKAKTAAFSKSGGQAASATDRCVDGAGNDFDFDLSVLVGQVENLNNTFNLIYFN